MLNGDIKMPPVTMIKLYDLDVKGAVYLVRGCQRQHIKNIILNIMTPAQQQFLCDVEWLARRHPKKGYLAEIYIDKKVFTKNKLLLAQMIFV
jgi:hypothetical protein